MPTLRAAAVLLAAASDIASLGAIAAAVGCAGPPASLDAESRTALGVPDECEKASVARGPGTLRAVLLDVRGERPMREVVSHVARRLSARAPHLLWLAIACRETTTEVAIAAWTPGQSGPRVSALLVDRTHVVDSDAETLCALGAAMESVDVLTHARWVAILGREAVTRRFYRTLERLVSSLGAEARGSAPAEARREIALLYASRLLFLSFLEAKEWLDGDRSFLARHYDACLSGRGGFHRRVLLPLFFGTLNTPIRSRAPAARALGRIPFLNGGLFSRSPLERTYTGLEFRDEELGLFLSDLLGRYRFTAREESTEWSEAAVDPEMLGRAFESMMASPERRKTGAFFTPHTLVARVTDEALAAAVGQPLDGIVSLAPSPNAIDGNQIETLRRRLTELRLLDPACGSGAFLVHALERIATVLAFLGDRRVTSELRRAVLTRSIFGVDISPTAVWLCQLRLWLSVVIDTGTRDPAQVTPLPNLDRNIRIGDALAVDDIAREGAAGATPIARLRARYARAVGVRKRTLSRALDRAERAAAIALLDRRIAAIAVARRDIILAARTRDLFGDRAAVRGATSAALDELRAERRACRARRRALAAGAALPFSFSTHFADVASAGGFDVVAGNPPWVRVHRIPPGARSALRRGFATYRGAAWRTGAAASRAGVGFAAQVDLASLFIERSLEVAAPAGVVALLVPAKLWRSLAGGGVRSLLASQHEPLAIEDWSDAPALFDAAVYPSLLVARRSKASGPKTPTEMRVTVHAARVAATWGVHVRELALDESPGAPWLLLPPLARRAFDSLRAVGTPLGTSLFGAPLLGVKCGCNGAFILRPRCDGLLTAETGQRVDVEPDLLRPLIRGEHVKKWRIESTGERVIWTHGPNGLPLDRLPPRAERWLRGWRRRLVARSDARPGARWWSLFRTEAATPNEARVVWADFGRVPTAALLEPGDDAVPLNTCYVVRCADRADAIALVTLLNSPLAAAWLGALAEPARGGYRRYLGWTLSLLPLPRQWDRARRDLADLGERALLGQPPSDAELLEAVVRTYRLRIAAVNALLDWNIR